MKAPSAGTICDDADMFDDVPDEPSSFAEIEARRVLESPAFPLSTGLPPRERADVVVAA